ncbi:elongator complex protein 2 [Bacillus rossius redtenbacheri]|uniref:elongator complex protein 2 n=1 Tax=Bacillus rossius redtenbacheri TaxID=93214 RepID=UPI002FDD0F1F
MEVVSVDLMYASCACNRNPHCLDWGNNNIICYGARNAVAFYDTKFAGGCKLVQMPCGHEGAVNAVRWARLQDGSPGRELVSASADGTAVIWTEGDAGRFAPSAVLRGHRQSVLLADAVYRPGDAQLVVVTASVDGCLKVWRRLVAGEVCCTQTLPLDPGVCLSLRLGRLPGPGAPPLLLAFGTDDGRIHLLAESGRGAEREFVPAGCLAGHEDWVRALDFAADDAGDLMLASAAQDKMIRLWRISLRRAHGASGAAKPNVLQTEEKQFSVLVDDEEQFFAYSLEAVLSGHDGWVYGVTWFPPVHSGGGSGERRGLQLLSSSLDKTMILWEAHGQSGVWLETARLGEVGGNTLGFYGCQVSPDGRSVVAHGYQGSLHMWHRAEGGASWVPGVVVGGHFGAVVDLCWEPGGQFLLSAGADQTTRLHAPWLRADGEATWHELARPQVHGYDMACLAVLSRYRFASGAEEKVVRAFRAPRTFVRSFQRVCGVDDAAAASEAALPQGASVPALGLSNKAVYESREPPPADRHVKDEFPEASFVPAELTEPPTEEDLVQNTLWPEVQKLYGHGYELYALAARADGRLLASACRATSPQHAAVLLWDTDSWQCTDRLESHQLTVTQLAFSPDGDHLLAVSRDRRWSLFRRQPPGDRYRLQAATDKQTCLHTRIVWCCSWAPDSRYFATGSRDGTVAVWPCQQGPGAVAPRGPPLVERNQSVTAVAMWLHAGSYLLAVGLDCGEVSLYRWLEGAGHCRLLHLGSNTAHHMTVRRLAFRPAVGATSDTREDGAAGSTLQLASGGADNAVKIHSIRVTT